MKPKIGLLALLIVLLFVPSYVFAQDLTIAVNKNVGNEIGAGEYGVVGSFKVTDSTAASQNSKITAFVLDARVGTIASNTLVAANIDSVAVWEDINRDGKLQRDVDKIVSSSNTFGSDATNPTTLALTGTNQITIADGADKYYIVVILTKEVLSSSAEGQVTDVVVQVKDGSDVASTVNSGGTAWTDDSIQIVATHLKWVTTGTTGYKRLSGGANSNMVQDGSILKAVDDFGNTDGGFSENLAFSAYNYSTLEDVTANLSVIDGANNQCKAGAGNYITTVGWTAGVLAADTGGGTTGVLLSMGYSTAGPVVIVATSQTKKLQGSVTICNEAAYLSGNTINGARGIEIYDTDHDGHIDHATIFFGVPMAVTAAVTDFTIADPYAFVTTVAPATEYDAGGYGIKNPGEYGVTLKIVEKDTYDTDIKPDITYSGSGAILQSKAASPTNVAAWSSAQVVEVDRSRPVLLNAFTRDLGIGTGTQSNGMIDGIEFIFSEPVRNVTAGTDSTGVVMWIDPGEGMSFNQGSGTIAGTKVTIPVAETTPNTGDTPPVQYNNVPAKLVTDHATTAAGAAFYNKFFPKKTDYSVVTTFDTRDGAPMVVHSVRTRDVGAGSQTANNGKVDGIEIIFSEVATVPSSTAGIAFYSDVASFSSGSLKNGAYTSLVPTGSGTTWTFPVTEVASTDPYIVYDSEALPKFSYDPTTGSITDGAGNELQQYGPAALEHPSTIDGVPPKVIKIATGDAYTDTSRVGASTFESEGADGRVDMLKLVFSEKVMTAAGAHFPGATTALDQAITQFEVTHSIAAEGVRALLTSAETVGKPTWTDKNVNGDTYTELVITFKEASNSVAGMKNGGDTGMLPTITYTASSTTARNIKDYASSPNNLLTTLATVSDGAKPVVIGGIGKGWAADAFANVLTYDKNENVKDTRAGVDNTLNGDGYLDGFSIKFTENVYTSATGTALQKFTTPKFENGTTLTFKHSDATLTAGSSADILVLYGSSDEKGVPDTGLTPVLTYTAHSTVRIQDQNNSTYDASVHNLLDTFELPSYDNAKPVVVSVNRGATDKDIKFTFSEQVWGHYSTGVNCPMDSAQVAGNVLFGYENKGGTGSSSMTSAYVTQLQPTILGAKLNADMTAGDIENDLVWVRTIGVYDNANANESGLSDNYAENSVAGSQIKLNIFDDVIAPWLIGAWTVDADGNGLIDHIKIRFSEAIKDTLIKGYVSRNTMSNNVAATWKLSGYTGTAMWNFFNYDDPGKKAAIAAGKPVFAPTAFVGGTNGLNDDVLYLELEEDKVPVYAGSGYGSTDWLPTITWGVGTEQATLGDISNNPLNTASTVTSPTSLKATNGTVLDDVGPVIMKAEYLSGKMTLYFSEAISDTNKAVKCNDFAVLDTYTYVCDDRSTSYNSVTAAYYGTSQNTKALGTKLWVSPGMMEMTFLSSWSWSATKAYGIQLAPETGVAATAPEGDDSECIFKDADLAGDDAATIAKKYGEEPNSEATLYYVFNEFCPTPYKALSCYDQVGLILIEGIPSLKLTTYTSATTMGAGKSVVIKWNSTNVDSVDVYLSRDYGNTFSMIEGSRTVATAGQYTWIAEAGVDFIQIQASAVADSLIKSKSGALTIQGTVAPTPGVVVGAPADLMLVDVPMDNGHWFFATFTVSADHLTRVKSYQFFREVDFGDAADPNDIDLRWVYSAMVPAGPADVNSKFTCLVPSVINGAARWAVAASSGDIVSDMAVATKEAEVPVAMLVDAAEKAAEGVVVSAMSEPVVGGAIDNIAPSPIADFSVDDADNGIQLSWTAPEDHGIVGYYGWAGVGQLPIYGVEGYEIWRSTSGSEKEAGAAEFVLVGVAAPMSTSYIDEVENGITVYDYFVKGVDGNPENAVACTPLKAMAFAGGADFNSNGTVGLGDLVLFGSQWGAKKGDANWISIYDLNKDGEVGLGDLVLLGDAWTITGKVAKEALPTTNDVAMVMNADYDSETATYFVNINVSEVDGFNGVGFTMSYDTEALELVGDGIVGLGTVSVTKVTDAGMIDINSYFMDKEFNGSITIAFKSKGMSKDLNFELVDASVSIDNVVSAVGDLARLTVDAVPTVYSLAQNFPNPFNPTTTIEYSIPQAGNVELVIFNMAGQKVRTLINEKQAASYKKVVWDGKNDMGETVGAGLYFYKLVSGNFSKIQKMTLIK